MTFCLAAVAPVLSVCSISAFFSTRSILKPRHEDAHLFKEGKTKTRCVNDVYPSRVIVDHATEETTRESVETEDSSVFNWNLDEEKAMNELVS